MGIGNRSWAPAGLPDVLERLGRIVGQEPERTFKVLVALCDVFGIEAGDLITYTATDTRQSRSKVANSAADLPLLNAYRPVKARIVCDD